MIKLKNVPFSEFNELVKFLGKDKDIYIIERIGRFFTNLNSEELFDLNHLCSMILNDDPSAEDVYRLYIENHPDAEMDETGKSNVKIDISDAWLLSLKSIDSLYAMAEETLKKNNYVDNSPHKVNSQVYNGKNLSNLKNYKSKHDYLSNKVLYFKKHTETKGLNKENLKLAEKTLSALKLPYTSLNKIIEIAELKISENWETFVEHFFVRMDALSHDIDLNNSSNKEFYNNLTEIK